MTDCHACNGTGNDYRCKWCGAFLDKDHECPECSTVTDEPYVFESSIRVIDCPVCEGSGELTKEQIKEYQY